jgi:hypothetical protein
VTIDGHKLRITEHAIEQFRNRCRPLDFTAAKGELFACLQDHGRIVSERPDWCRAAVAKHGTVAWLLIGDSVVLPILEDGTVPTCLVRGGITDDERARRKARKRHRFHRTIETISPNRRERKATASKRARHEAWS